MSLWQFGAFIEGWNRHHSPDEDKGVPLSDEEAAELGSWLDQGR